MEERVPVVIDGERYVPERTCVRCEVEQVGSEEELGSTERGAAGHGSTGVR